MGPELLFSFPSLTKHRIRLQRILSKMRCSSFDFLRGIRSGEVGKNVVGRDGKD